MMILRACMLLKIFPRSWKHYLQIAHWSELSHLTTVTEFDFIFLCLLLTVFKSHSFLLPFRPTWWESLNAPSFGSGGWFKPKMPLLMHGTPHSSPTAYHHKNFKLASFYHQFTQPFWICSGITCLPPLPRKPHYVSNTSFHTHGVCR